MIGVKTTRTDSGTTALAELIAADIAAYLADIDVNAAIPAAHLADRQLRSAIWFGISGFADSEEENTRLDDPNWNPLAWAWEQTAEHIARHVAHVAAEEIAQLYNGDGDSDAESAAALVTMFAIPLDVITTRATEELYKATRDSHPAAAQDDIDNDFDSVLPEDADGFVSLENSVEVEELTDPDDAIPIESISYYPTTAGVW